MTSTAPAEMQHRRTVRILVALAAVFAFLR
jgi:hypothetical protein